MNLALRFLSQVTDFLSGQPVVDDVARKDASDITEEKLQIRQTLCPLQEALSRLANHEKEQKVLKREIVGLREARQRESGVKERNLEQERIVCLLQRKVFERQLTQLGSAQLAGKPETAKKRFTETVCYNPATAPKSLKTLRNSRLLAS
jgi:hypothetical protein